MENNKKSILFMIVNVKGEPILDSQLRPRIYQSYEQFKKYYYRNKGNFVKVFLQDDFKSAEKVMGYLLSWERRNDKTRG